MKTIRFTAYPDGYKCSEPGDQSGEYVKAEVAHRLLYCLAFIISDLPSKRDWLNPDIEREAKQLIAQEAE